MEISSEKKIEFLKMMLRIRLFKMAGRESIQKTDIPAFGHLYVGEEAIATGICAVLNANDYITSNHRGHGHCIAKGADLNRLMAELWGKETGYCKGRGGSMHIYVKELGILGTNGIVGGGLALSLGPALHAKLNKTKQVCACFFGDGAANNGTFHESLNIAAVQNLPLIFVCENNLYATVTRVNQATKTKNFADRGAAYNMPGVIIDGNDVLDVFKKANRAIKQAREGEGPTLLECKTYRHFGHYVGEPGTWYRPEKEREEWNKKDSIKRLSIHLEETKILTAKEIKSIKDEVGKEVEGAVEFARNSPLPRPETVTEYVWAGERK